MLLHRVANSLFYHLKVLMITARHSSVFHIFINAKKDERKDQYNYIEMLWFPDSNYLHCSSLPDTFCLLWRSHVTCVSDSMLGYQQRAKSTTIIVKINILNKKINFIDEPKQLLQCHRVPDIFLMLYISFI